MLSSADAITTVFVADDVDRGWDEIGPYLMHDALMYGAWNPDRVSASVSQAQSIEELRAEPGGAQIWSVEQAVDAIKAGQGLPLMPLCGGVPPELAWQYLRRVVDDVLPATK